MIDDSVELITNTYKNIEIKFEKIMESLKQFSPILDAIAIDVDQL